MNRRMFMKFVGCVSAIGFIPNAATLNPDKLMCNTAEKSHQLKKVEKMEITGAENYNGVHDCVKTPYGYKILSTGFIGLV